MKHRIIVHHGKYIPQHRFLWFFWLCYVEFDFDFDCSCQVAFDSRPEADEFLAAKRQEGEL